MKISDFFKKVLYPKMAAIDREPAGHYLRSMAHKTVTTDFIFWNDLPEETKNIYRGMRYTEEDLAILRRITDQSFYDEESPNPDRRDGITDPFWDQKSVNLDRMKKALFEALNYILDGKPPES